jgi:hypothetical protein
MRDEELPLRGRLSVLKEVSGQACNHLTIPAFAKATAGKVTPDSRGRHPDKSGIRSTKPFHIALLIKRQSHEFNHVTI